MFKKFKLRFLTSLLLFILISTSISSSISLASSYNITYDSNGNLIQDSDNYYEYNGLNQLKRVRENNSTGQILEEYIYDHEGNRLKKVEVDIVYGNTTTYYVSDDYIRIVNSSGTFDEVYYYHDDVLVASNNSQGDLRFYHPDHLGSTTLVTNKSGSVIEETTYLPFGEAYEGGNSRFTYTGKEKDDTGLMYYGARYYDTNLKHFTQPDLIIQNIYNPQSLNHYSYVLNNPYKYTDPDGNSFFDPNAPGDPAGFLEVVNEYIAVYNLAKENQELARKQLESELRTKFNDWPKVEASNMVVSYSSFEQSSNRVTSTKYTFSELQKMELSKEFNINLNKQQDIVGYNYKGKSTTINLMEKRGFSGSNLVKEISSKYQQ